MRSECFIDPQLHIIYCIVRERRRWMESGKECSNIVRLYMEGSSEETMSWKDREQKAKKEELLRDVSKLFFKKQLRSSRRNIKKEAL